MYFELSIIPPFLFRVETTLQLTLYLGMLIEVSCLCTM